MKRFDCERTTAAVPRDCLFMGLALGELSSLVVEGAYHARRNRMIDDKMMGVVRHFLTAFGGLFVYMGYTDDATWVMVSGAIATMIGFTWSWMAKA